MPAGFFVTGTDTDVGKTVLSALLCAALDGTYWKPIQTGAVEGTDRSCVARIAELAPEKLVPERYCFDLPLSPHLAAKRQGATIRLSQIVLPAVNSTGPLIVEGAGGVMVPINDDEFMSDLIRQLGLPAIVTARSTLGTINHTLLTLAALSKAEVKTTGVVMIGNQDRDNLTAIERYGKVPVIGRVPRLESINRASLRRVFDEYFDKRYFQYFQRA